MKKKKCWWVSWIFSVGLFIVNYTLNIVKNYKPIIYLYTDKKQKVKVKVKYPEKLTCTYPKYMDNWEVIASPNGDLEDCKTGRKLYALYWEGKRNKIQKIERGFCIKGEDTIEFLEEKLALARIK